MARHVIDEFLDALKGAFIDTTRDFADRVVREQMPQAPRVRRVSGKVPKQPKPPKAAKVNREGPTLYQVLGVDPGAEPELIEAAWKAKARLYHPDRTKGAAAAERMKAVNHAHDALSDPVKRREYDKQLRREP